MTTFTRVVNPFEVTELELPGPLISKAQSGRVNIRSTEQMGYTWTERYLLQVSSTTHRGFLATVRNYWRNGAVFDITHVDYLTRKGAGGGSPLVAGAGQTGSTLLIDGASATITNWLRAGDIFTVDGGFRVLEASADVNTNGSGQASIPLVVPIFSGGSPVDNAALTTTGVVFRACLLAPPEFPTTSGRSADYGELLLQFSEVLTAEAAGLGALGGPANTVVAAAAITIS